jgi:hypothetical protein
MRNAHPAGDDHWTRRTPDRVRRGPDSHAAILTHADRADIRAVVAARPDVNRSWLARKYGVSRVTIWRVTKDMAS